MATLTSPTLGSLITNVRNMLGQPTATNSTWTDAELAVYINEAVRMYFAEVVKNYEGYFATTTDPSDNLTYTAGTEAVALPSDCYQVRAIYIKRNQGWQMLDYVNDLTGSYSTSTGAGSETYSPTYFFQGNSIVLRPVPNDTGTESLKVDYIQLPDQMVNGGDQLTNQISPIFKQLIECYAIRQAKMKQSLSQGVDLTAIPNKNLGEIYASFKNAITPRSASPQFVQPFNPE